MIKERGYLTRIAMLEKENNELKEKNDFLESANAQKLFSRRELERKQKFAEENLFSNETIRGVIDAKIKNW